MLKIYLEPTRESLDLTLPAHRAIRDRLTRRAWDPIRCDCAEPWTSILLAQRWDRGEISVVHVRACCDRRQATLTSLLPFEDEPTVGAHPKVLLFGTEGTSPMPPEGLLASVVGLPKAWSLDVTAPLVIRLESELVVDGHRLTSLALRAFEAPISVEEAVRHDHAIRVMAYWRRGGFDWTPRSLKLARRFGLGVGGSFLARLERVLPSQEWPRGAEPLSTHGSSPLVSPEGWSPSLPPVVER